jgi:hypothetical protein
VIITEAAAAAAAAAVRNSLKLESLLLLEFLAKAQHPVMASIATTLLFK